MLRFYREDGTEVPVPTGARRVITFFILLAGAVLVLAAVGLGALIAAGF